MTVIRFMDIVDARAVLELKSTSENRETAAAARRVLSDKGLFDQFVVSRVKRRQEKLKKFGKTA